MQPAADERPIGMTNDWRLLAAAALAVACVLWTALFAAYRKDRADAYAVASITVLLVVPPLASYYAAMQLTRDWRPGLRTAGIAALAGLWLVAQRTIVYPWFGLRASLGESVANLILLPAFGIALWFAAQGLADRRRLAQAMALQRQTELRLLDAQLAPHTLFNMLNAVYAVLLTDPPRAAPLFASMAEALRHVVDRTRERWVPLHDELAFIEHYAALERARQPQRVAIRIASDGDLDVPVPPMLLATLFENAVKHGRFEDGTLAVDVDVSVDDTTLRFSVTNRCPPAARTAPRRGLGLDNVRDRLRLIYGDRGRLEAGLDGDRYRAAIVIAP